MTRADASSWYIDVRGERYARWYEDGPPTWPLSDQERVEAERAYRAAFLDAARQVTTWPQPDTDLVEDAWRSRIEARDAASIKVPSADYYCVTDPDRRNVFIGHQIVYRVGHSTEAARCRGRHQALAIAADEWRWLAERGVPAKRISASLVPTWLTQVEAWAIESIDPQRIVVPPRLFELMSEDEMAAHDETAIDAESAPPPYLSVRDLLAGHPNLRSPVIHGLLRAGETMNVIAPPKTGKSWLVLDLAIAVATGRAWLGRFDTERGDVLLIDNELHPETTANRIPKVARARSVPFDDIARTFYVANLRGGLQDIVSLGPYFDALQPGRFRVIILDAWYRFMPADTDENDNGTMASLYNRLDHHASRLGCSFVLIHHATKGSQAAKSITDVGAGAGAQSRATDTHLVLRQHEEDDVIVLDAAVRSWPPIEPVCLRRVFPIWDVDDSLDPTLLRREHTRRRTRVEKPPKPTPEPWTPERFVRAFVTETPQVRDEIMLAAEGDLSNTKAKQLLKVAESQGLVHRRQQGYSDRVRFSTEPPPADGDGS